MYQRTGPAPAVALDSFMRPKSIAVVGASRVATSPGGRVVANLRGRFAGSVFAVNAKAGPGDKELFRDLADLPEIPELVVIATPAPTVAGVLGQAGDLGSAAAVVLSAGFDEVASVAAAPNLGAVARNAGIRVIGPNTIGVMNVEAGVLATFSNVVGLDNTGGSVAIVSQSGGMSAILYDMLVRAGVGVGYLCATGNESDVTVGDAVDWAVRQPGIRTVVGFLESVTDWAKFESAARYGHAHGARLAFCRAGKSEVGRTASKSHVAAVAGADAVLSDLFRLAGIEDATSLEDLVDVARGRQQEAGPFDGTFAVVTSSGGGGVLLSDLAEEFGLRLPELSEGVRQSLREVVPAFASVTNPVDCTASVQANPEQFRAVLELVARSGDVQGLVPQLGPLDPIAADLVDAVLAVKRALPGLPMAVAWGGGDPKFKQRLSAAGVPTFDDPRRALRGLAALVTREPAPAVECVARPSARPANVAPGSTLSEWQVRELLAPLKVPLPVAELAATAQDAVEAAERIGGKVVLKLLAPGLDHKSDAGGVRLGLLGANAVREAATDLFGIGAGLGLDEVAVLVEQQAPAGIELLCAFRQEPGVGPVVALGLGGMYTEALREVHFLPAPTSVPEAERLVDRLCEGRLTLGGPRGISVAARERLAQLVRAVGTLGVDHRWLSDLELNPVIVSGDDVWVCDGLASVTGTRDAR